MERLSSSIESTLPDRSDARKGRVGGSSHFEQRAAASFLFSSLLFRCCMKQNVADVEGIQFDLDLVQRGRIFERTCDEDVTKLTMSDFEKLQHIKIHAIEGNDILVASQDTQVSNARSMQRLCQARPRAVSVSLLLCICVLALCFKIQLQLSPSPLSETLDFRNRAGNDQQSIDFDNHTLEQMADPIRMLR